MQHKGLVKPTDIFSIMELAKRARKLGLTFNPLFSGEAGLGKSEIVQQWVANERKVDPEFGFIDLRMAYMEPPDVIGLPKIAERKVEGKTFYVTEHILPDMLPTSGSGVLFIEEPNRANSSVMNCLMQLLTDRKIHKYSLPEGWIIAAAINPEGGKNDVNSMDCALTDRFEIYPVKYDAKVFFNFIKENKWHPMVQAFITAGALWLYKTPDELGEEGTYVSPRTWSRLNNAFQAGLEEFPDLVYNTVLCKLGDVVGKEFYKFLTNNAPILAQDFIEDKKDALKRLKKLCDPESYRGDIVNIIVESLSDFYEKGIDDQVILDVCKIIPKDQAVNLLQGCVLKSPKKDRNLGYFRQLDPTLDKTLKDVLRGDKKNAA